MWTDFERIKPRLAEIARYVYPEALAGLVRDPHNLYDADATYDADDAKRLTNVPFDAFRIAVSGFYTNLTNPASVWFRLASPQFVERDPENEDFDAAQYAKITAATLWLTGWSGSYRALHMCFKHLVAFGFAAILAEDDDARIVRAVCQRPGTYALDVDRSGKVDSIVRRFSFNAESLVDEFGSDLLPKSILDKAAKGDRKTRFEVWNLVEPHRRRKGVDSPYSLSFDKFSYRSVYWCPEARANGEQGLLAVRGHAVKPLVAPRLSFEHGDVYGRGCGADVLGHCKALQTLAEIQLDLAEQDAHPSLMAPASMEDDGLRLGPYEVNYYPDSLGGGAVYRTIPEQQRGELAALEQQRIETEIRKALFNTEFETINAMQDSDAARSKTPDMTATEVRARVAEKMEQLSGIASTLNDELLDPFVTLMASFAIRAGLTDAELPEASSGPVPWDVKYESAIHAAANVQPINAAMQAVSDAAAIAQASGDPAVFDNFDFDAFCRDVYRRLGAPEKYLRDSADRDAMREERAQAHAAQVQAEQNALNARALADAMSAPVSPETVGGALASAGNPFQPQPQA